MKRALSTIPLFVLLLPLFFVLHGYRENFGHIPVVDALILFLWYTLAIIICGGIFFIITRNLRKAALITFVIFSIYFFYGAIQDFLKDFSPLAFMSRYRFLLSALLFILLVTLIYSFRTKSKLVRLCFFLNCLFLLYIGVELVRVAMKSGDDQPVGAWQKLMSKCDDCPKPNIYFLVFDSYASSASLKKLWGFNNPIDSVLISKGFSVQSQSRSNYNFTPFSISSILNMSYVEPLHAPLQLQPEDYMACNTSIRKSFVTAYLQANGYSIVNYSIFDLGNQPTLAKETFLPLKGNLITENTLYARVARDMGEWLFLRFPFKYFRKHPWMEMEKNNKLFLDMTMKTAKEKSSQPRFVYSHVYMPHRPYFFDRHGNRKADSTVTREFYERDINAYLDYMLYTNTRIEEVIDTIQKNDPAAVILFMGDHGHRVKATDSFPDHFFSNMNAVYYPDKDYQMFYDDISGVNQFRAVMNKWFRQSLPMLKDSMTLLEPAKNNKP